MYVTKKKQGIRAHFIGESTLDPRGTWLRGLPRCEIQLRHVAGTELLTPSDFLFEGVIVIQVIGCRGRKVTY